MKAFIRWLGMRLGVRPVRVPLVGVIPDPDDLGCGEPAFQVVVLTSRRWWATDEDERAAIAEAQVMLGQAFTLACGRPVRMRSAGPLKEIKPLEFNGPF